MEEIELSVVVPLAPGEDLSVLMEKLRALPDSSEVIFAAASAEGYKQVDTSLPGVPVRFIANNGGRAGCMNAGAKIARSRYLWFLHADSLFDRAAVNTLLSAIQKYPDALLFFDLAYQGGPVFMRFNEWGANFRSRILNTPFGDQGFCICRDVFEQLGGYPEGEPYGEDHLFVRNARRNRVPVVSTNHLLYTSPRKYEKNGWLRTTALHLYLWRKQAWQDVAKYRRMGSPNGIA